MKIFSHDSIVVKYLPHHPKVEGLSPPTNKNFNVIE
jgi:hypothetical protein